MEIGVSAADAEKQFAGFTFLDATQQAGADWLGGKLGQDLFSTAQFLLTQDGIAKVAPESTYADGVDPGPAKAAAGE